MSASVKSHNPRIELMKEKRLTQVYLIAGCLWAIGKQLIRHHLHMSLQQKLKPGTLIWRQWLAPGGFYTVGIHRLAVDTGLIVHMGAGGLAGSPDFGNRLSLFHMHALFDQQAAAVAVVGHVTVGMADDY